MTDDDSCITNTNNSTATWLLPRDRLRHKVKIYNPATNEIEKLLVYSSGYTPGMQVRNALNGRYYDINVGSHKENLLFKVHWGFGNNKEPLNLFFQRPEEFEKAFCTEINWFTRDKWYNKREAYLRLFNKKGDDAAAAAAPAVTVVK
jgi:hypothetical protein